MTQAELQERIDALIVGIQDAEAAGEITAEIVGEVLGFLNDSSKSITANVADVKQKLTDVQSAVNRLLGHNATEAIENFNEVINFLAGLKDTDTLAAKLTDITGQLADHNSRIGLRATKAELQAVDAKIGSTAYAGASLTAAVAGLQSAAELANDELETHKQRLDALTPVVLTQAEYDALVAAGTVRPNQHYAIIEDAEA